VGLYNLERTPSPLRALNRRGILEMSSSEGMEIFCLSGRKLLSPLEGKDIRSMTTRAGSVCNLTLFGLSVLCLLVYVFP
jgi:hypothetical protein